MSDVSGAAACDDAPVRLSVVIPVHDGAAFLERCLASLRRSNHGSFECLVVDDGSSDDPASVAARYGATCLRLDTRTGPARARNFGAEAARGDLIVFLDADVCVHPDTLTRIDDHLRQYPEVVAVIGSYDDQPVDPHMVSQYKNLLHHYVHQRSQRQAWTFWAGCGAVRRVNFAAIGGFDESYVRPCVEDIELGFRLRRAGHRIDLNPTIQVTHLKRWTLAGLVRTDVRDRAVPWLLLMLRDRTLPRDLNLRLAHRLSVALVWLLAAAAAGALCLPDRSGLWLVVTAAGAVLVGLNFDLYRFFARQRGAVFALCGIALHWLYYWYCGLAVAFALLVYSWQRLGATYRRARRLSAVRASTHG